jgi:hypothetical protein
MMQENRYQNRPVYSTDGIVAADSPYFSPSELAGKTFCYIQHCLPHDEGTETWVSFESCILTEPMKK